MRGVRDGSHHRKSVVFLTNILELGVLVGDNSEVINRDASGSDTACDPNQSADGTRDMAKPQSTKSPAFQFYPRDFLSSGKVDRMPMTERGAYITLLSRCWLDNGLPTDLAELAGIVRLNAKQFTRMWNNSQIGKCFFERGGKFFSERLEHERKVQSEFRKKQTDKANKRWESHGNAVAMPGNGTRQASGNAPLPRSLPLPQSASAKNTETAPPSARPMAPIHDNSHRKHAHCGRVCLPAGLFSEFVGRRNHVNADREVRDWAMDVEREWGPGGPKAAIEPGDAYDFWRERYAEKWPAAAPAAKKAFGGWKPS